VVIANHNSHLDLPVILSLFRFRDRLRVRPVAAADYFCRSRLSNWIVLRVLGAIPCRRGGWKRRDGHPLANCFAALERGDILVLFPEGTRGEPERLACFKTGVAHLSRRCPEVPVVPLFIRGTGRSLPRGAVIPLPVSGQVQVGEPLTWTGDRGSFMAAIETEVARLERSPRRPASTRSMRRAMYRARGRDTP
jgi:1-acyl-sn-glycerol-3-phosphate acyltransferase